MMLPSVHDTSPRTLIDDLLGEQQRLTAVERFSRNHERHDLPAQSRYYRDLIPLTQPARGAQYAFAVDLDNCTGCKACVSACHSLNGLDEDETWRDIGLLHGGTVAEPYQQTVTTACHHCVEPACLNGCPVKAYEKDAGTGIVRHLDDQCIGCQYCVLKCPYDVPKYSKKRGIVRKCDMCHGRLAAGEAPACVQACPSGAITIRIVEKADYAAGTMAGGRLLPGAFDSGYTKPTTAYTTRRGIPKNARPGDSGALRLEHAHWPLIWMLVLTQVAAGIFVCAAAMAFGSPAAFRVAQAPLAGAAFIALNLGLALSVLHLGRPLGAWRAFLGLRTSWMSREIFAFGMFAASSSAFAVASFWGIAVGRIPKMRVLETLANPAHFAIPLAVVTAVLGMAGVFCSAMIYVDTQRAFWNRRLTFPRFFGGSLLLGAAAAAAVMAWTGVCTGAPPIVFGPLPQHVISAKGATPSQPGATPQVLSGASIRAESPRHFSSNPMERAFSPDPLRCQSLGVAQGWDGLGLWPSAGGTSNTMYAPAAGAIAVLSVAATILRAALFGWEFKKMRGSLRREDEPNHRSALVVWNLRRPLAVACVVLFFGSTLSGLSAAGGMGVAISATLSFLLTLASQVIERYFFFTAVVAYRMPGGVTA